MFLGPRLRGALVALVPLIVACSDGDSLTGPVEFARLATSFDAMRMSLEQTISESASRRSLAAVGEFAASLSHELRNSLTAVQVDLARASEKLSDVACAGSGTPTTLCQRARVRTGPRTIRTWGARRRARAFASISRIPVRASPPCEERRGYHGVADSGVVDGIDGCGSARAPCGRCYSGTCAIWWSPRRCTSPAMAATPERSANSLTKYRPSLNVRISFVDAPTGWQAVATQAQRPDFSCVIFVGLNLEMQGEPLCRTR